MTAIVREPLGLRVLIRAIRLADQEPFWLWRAAPQPEVDALIEAGQADDRALLWASLLRWSEAQAVARVLGASGWTLTLHGVRAIVLDRATTLLQPPAADQGWIIAVADLQLRAVPETPEHDQAALERLLAFLDP